MDRQMTFVSAVFFTIVGLLVLSNDIKFTYFAIAIILLTVAVIQWANYLILQKQHKEFIRKINENKKQKQTPLFDQNATQEFNPTNDWNV